MYKNTQIGYALIFANVIVISLLGYGFASAETDGFGIWGLAIILLLFLLKRMAIALGLGVTSQLNSQKSSWRMQIFQITIVKILQVLSLNFYILFQLNNH